MQVVPMRQKHPQRLIRATSTLLTRVKRATAQLPPSAIGLSRNPRSDREIWDGVIRLGLAQLEAMLGNDDDNNPPAVPAAI